jgi:serine/threonine protein kinase
VLGALLAIPLGVVAIIYLIVPLFKAIGWIIARIFTFVFGVLGDVLRFIGAIVTALVLVPLTVGNVVIGRWSAAAHFGRAIKSEGATLGRCLYRIVVGHPARLFCLSGLTEGLEKRIPEVVAAAPGPDRPARRVGQFEGYKIVGSLQGGGSGGKLYVAEPLPFKLAAFARNGHPDAQRVVIKSFSLKDGSSLPQIVRENRALDAARRLGLILEHELTDERFFYVMKYVPGDSLNLVTQRLHAASGPGGLGGKELREAIEYSCDLVRTLCHYHAGGLWHKDVKPDNIIIHDGQAHLVDFGLITPLRSSMTLTTHGTEYFRDPEMVRMALKGVKVHEVDGAKFDVYAAGAVLYSMVENSFPAHGGLSQITRRCPEAIRWVVRRAMTDYDKRYQSAGAMLGDLEAILAASDPFTLKPVDLPSMREPGAGAEYAAAAAEPARGFNPPPIPPIPPVPPIPGRPAWEAPSPAHVGEPVVIAAAATVPLPSPGRTRPKIRVTDWWKGTYAVDSETVEPGAAPAAGAAPHAAAANAGPHVRPASFTPRRTGFSASEQLKHARERARAARQRAHRRMGIKERQFPSGINAGVAVAVFLFLVACVFVLGAVFLVSNRSQPRSTVFVSPPVPPMPGVPRVIVGPGKAEAAAARFEQKLGTHDEAASPLAAGERVLVLCEWSTFDNSLREEILARIEDLEAAGFRLVGDTAPGKRGDEYEAESVASLRKAVGTRLVSAPDTGAVVQDWLGREERAELVLWVDQKSGVPRGEGYSLALFGNGDRPGLLELARSALDGERN